jgi:hypothetical protein
MSIENLNTLGDLDAFVAERVALLGFTPAAANRINNPPAPPTIPVTVAGGGTALLDMGTFSLSWSAQTAIGPITKTHGLGVTPSFVYLTQVLGGTFTVHAAGTYTGSGFDVSAATWDGSAFTGSTNYVYLAVA